MNEADNPGSERRLKLRKTPRQERSIQRLEAILAAATDLLAEKGVQGLKMTEIAAAAGISIGSLYQFFPERAAVLRALHDQHTQRVELGARRAFAGVASLDQAIERLPRRSTDSMKSFAMIRSIGPSGWRPNPTATSRS